MAGLNSCSFIGNLGADPEIRSLQGGARVASFSVAVSEKWKTGSGERKERTEWVPVVVWAEGLVKIAEQFLRKGGRVYIRGKFQTRSWEDEGGANRYKTEIVLQPYHGELILLGDANNSDGRQAAPRGEGQREMSYHRPPDADMDDEIPF